MSENLFRKNWLKSLDEEKVINLGLTKETEDFLISKGLPLDNIEIEQNLYTKFFEDLRTSPRFKVDGYEYLAIADNEDNYICINIQNDEIVAIKSNNKEVQFINSDLENFLLFLELYLNTWQIYENGTDEEGFEATEKIKDKMLSIDSKALKPRAWWREIILDKEMMLSP